MGYTFLQGVAHREGISPAPFRETDRWNLPVPNPGLDCERKLENLWENRSLIFKGSKLVFLLIIHCLK